MTEPQTVCEESGAEVHTFRVSAAAAGTREPGAREPLSPEEREKADGFVQEADRDRYVVAHLALRRLLAERLGTDPGAVPFTRADCPVCGAPHGRPSVAGDPVHFSLSHAGDLVLIAFAPVQVGVDVERHPSSRAVAQTSSALHPREQRELAAVPEGEARSAAFARCWTRKEAYLKGTGAGLGEDVGITYVGTLEGRPAEVPGWRLADLEAAPGYAAALAIRER
ncbi:4'-phosphopantetheinyl transferase superfamily protein [Streptomyces sp. SB3404]|uniref:4'-phosphopantetheinyl transferase superfamily protein n=2 Tax=Streptomyces boncukensis TaxID=2711219 RepID=A0A6G4X332_9ACTN|nr:4'-phosphopantetheinyl transferase superfamily protein [Streptomyces boncukensis]